jgi:hypothetical protein
MLIIIPVPEAMLVLFIDLFVDYTVSVGKPKKIRELGKPRRTGGDKSKWLSKREVSGVC